MAKTTGVRGIQVGSDNIRFIAPTLFNDQQSPLTLAQILSLAYENDNFVSNIGFGYASDSDSDGETYGTINIITENLVYDSEQALVGANYVLISNGKIYYAQLTEPSVGTFTYPQGTTNPLYSVTVAQVYASLTELSNAISNALNGITNNENNVTFSKQVIANNGVSTNELNVTTSAVLPALPTTTLNFNATDDETDTFYQRLDGIYIYKTTSKTGFLTIQMGTLQLVFGTPTNININTIISAYSVSPDGEGTPTYLSLRKEYLFDSCICVIKSMGVATVIIAEEDA